MRDLVWHCIVERREGCSVVVHGRRTLHHARVAPPPLKLSVLTTARASETLEVVAVAVAIDTALAPELGALGVLDPLNLEAS